MTSRILSLLVGCILLTVTAASSWAQGPLPWGPARWVWDQPAAHETDLGSQVIFLRRVFELPAAPKAAKLLVTVDNRYTLYVNGEKIGSDGEWNTVEQYDVAKHLVAGKNSIAIEAANDGGPAGAIVWLAVTTSEGKHVVLGSDAAWKTSTTAISGWQKTAFDDRKWAAATVLGPVGTGPWSISGGDKKGGPSEDVQVTDRTIDKYRPASEELANFQLPEGFKIELVSGEPLVINPVCLALDEEGRIYVSESHTYRFGPQGSPVKKPTNPIVRLDPKPSGPGFDRVLVAEGFDDPVMGMLVRGGKLWAAANNFLYQFDLPAAGPATNKKLLVEDKSKAWNPFGMFVLEWGPEGLLYMSVGNHDIRLEGPGGKLTARGGSGLVCRMQPDGSDMQRLVHGLRVPYSFELDPFGQMWLLSNGEGNPNRFVRVIEGVDYHCYSRPAADNNWLAGNHPLAPPCFELPGGACTQLVRYYGANFPASYQGSLFLDNWGRHGFGGANRTIFRYVPDERGNIVAKEPFLVCKDPHFRCSHVLLSPDGGFYIADWYGRDDESDLTGRIWKVTYSGSDQPKVEHELKSPQWSDIVYELSALGSPDHLVRAKAMDRLVSRGTSAVPRLAEHSKSAKEPLGAANALWALSRLGRPEATRAIAVGGEHGDWRVRRLALSLLRRFGPKDAEALGKKLLRDTDPNVRVEAALALSRPEETRVALVEALRKGAAADPHLCYEAAWHLARTGDKRTFQELLTSDSDELRTAGYQALDIALYEAFESKSAALAVLSEGLAHPAGLNTQWLVLLARLNRDPTLATALSKFAESADVSAAESAQAVMLLRQISPEKKELSEVALTRLREAIRSGQIAAGSPSDAVLVLEAMAGEGPTPFVLAEAPRRLVDKDRQVRETANGILRSFGTKADSTAASIWPRLFDEKAKLTAEERAELAATLVAIESEPDLTRWERLLAEGEPAVVRDVVRSWRAYLGRPPQVEWLLTRTPEVIKRDALLKADLALVLGALKIDASKTAAFELSKPPGDPQVRRAAALAAKTDETSVWLGRRVFDRAGCVKCHTTINANTPRAPSLAGIGKAQPPEYLLESLFEPSKVIKTGFETEQIETEDGQVLSGLVKERGDDLQILTADKEILLPKKEVARRAVQKISLMPQSQFDQLSQDELIDLLAYLKSLR